MNHPTITDEADFQRAILNVLPMAEFGEDNEGQVIIYTNCDWYELPSIHPTRSAYSHFDPRW
jgi:hypothetical protein